jgi:hypothetical protein
MAMGASASKFVSSFFSCSGASHGSFVAEGQYQTYQYVPKSKQNILELFSCVTLLDASHAYTFPRDTGCKQRVSKKYVGLKPLTCHAEINGQFIRSYRWKGPPAVIEVRVGFRVCFSKVPSVLFPGRERQRMPSWAGRRRLLFCRRSRRGHLREGQLRRAIRFLQGPAS